VRTTGERTTRRTARIKLTPSVPAKNLSNEDEPLHRSAHRPPLSSQAFLFRLRPDRRRDGSSPIGRSRAPTSSDSSTSPSVGRHERSSLIGRRFFQAARPAVDLVAESQLLARRRYRPFPGLLAPPRETSFPIPPHHDTTAHRIRDGQFFRIGNSYRSCARGQTRGPLST
jgi:hypothetical protein